jgi:hypothetical protein
MPKPPSPETVTLFTSSEPTPPSSRWMQSPMAAPLPSECPLLIYSCSFPRSRLLFAHPQGTPLSKDRIIGFTHHHHHRHHHHLLILLTTLYQLHSIIRSIPAPASPTIPPRLVCRSSPIRSVYGVFEVWRFWNKLS